MATKSLSSSLTISESLSRNSNNMKMGLIDDITIVAEIPEIYKIIRKGDTAFVRSNIY